MYSLEFRSIDPARKWTSNGYKYVRGFNKNGMVNANNIISEEEKQFLNRDFDGTEKKKLEFFILPYQRGFRWERKNVSLLLSDIYAYANVNKEIVQKTSLNNRDDFYEENFDFYCLQTISVKAINDNTKWEVIDGQQRLTCVYLMYSLLSLFCGYPNTPYNITYKRNELDNTISEDIEKSLKDVCDNMAPAPRDFFDQEMDDISQKQEWFDCLESSIIRRLDTISSDGSLLIDLYFIKNAVKEILKFISDGHSKDEITNMFNCIKRNVYFLWYEIPKEKNSEEIFLNINSGSIPLTNAELIKSIVLESKQGNVKENSKDWEHLEQGLSNSELWSFVAGDFKTDTRIDLILDVFARTNAAELEEKDKYGLFDWFSEYKKTKENDFAGVIIEGLKDIFDRIDEWYNDVQIYHYVGLLSLLQKRKFVCKIAIDDTNNEYSYKNQQTLLQLLLRRAENSTTKATFVVYLKDCIARCILCGIKEENRPGRLSELISNETSYENDFFNFDESHDRVENILWLVTIYETINSSDNREMKNGCNENIKYKKSICRRFPFSEALSGKWTIEHIFPQQPEDKETDLRQKYDENIGIIEEKGIKIINYDNVRYIKNLALLKAGPNSSLKNEMLGEKRRRLIKDIGTGEYIPGTTINTFMLYYNDVDRECRHEQNALESGINWEYWTEFNAENYEKAIIRQLNQFEGKGEKK